MAKINAVERLEGFKAFVVGNGIPDAQYQANTFKIAEESIAEAGYRLADLLETLFGH